MKQITTRKKCTQYKCKGEILGTGTAFTNSIGTYYEHQCCKCGFIVQLTNFYPSTEIKYTAKEKMEKWI